MKRSVAVVIGEPRRGAHFFVAVKRPEEDAELPGVWGLPASSLEEDEDWAEAVVRTGRDKLGVELRPGQQLGEGSAERPGYRLAMKLYSAEILAGVPAVPQSVLGVTQYSEWQWAEAPILVPGDRCGSLCCRLYLEHADS